MKHQSPVAQCVAPSPRMFLRGFTLIELLVVIAIIGILSSVVLSALNTARSKGSDAAVKSNLANARPDAALFYDTNNQVYTGVCATSGTNVIGNEVNAAEKAYSGGAVTTYVNGTGSTWNTAQCHAIGLVWAAWVPLRDSTSAAPLGWCVDSTGNAKQVTTVLGGNNYVCP